MTEQLEIPPRGTRGRQLTTFFYRLLSPLLGLQVSRYRKKSEPEKMAGVPLVILTTIGAKTGRERTSMLGGFKETSGDWLVVGSKGGSISQPAWYINLAKNPDKVWLEVGPQKFKVTPELLKGDEYETAHTRVIADSPQYTGYWKVTDRTIPIVRLRRD